MLYRFRTSGKKFVCDSTQSETAGSRREQEAVEGSMVEQQYKIVEEHQWQRDNTQLVFNAVVVLARHKNEVK